MKTTTVGWFEIPVVDMERAIKFYEAVFETKLSRNKMGVLDMAWFPSNEENGKGAGGTLIHFPGFYKPSAEGVLVYFSSHDVNNELNRVEQAGGKIVVPRKEISPDVGFMAVFSDTEGNRVALHSRQ
jgi:predicted enzyme related to lactoylglutathione lyase